MRKKIKETKSLSVILTTDVIVLWAEIKDYLLGELVNYDQDSVKPGGWLGVSWLKSIEIKIL